MRRGHNIRRGGRHVRGSHRTEGGHYLEGVLHEVRALDNGGAPPHT